MCYTVIIFFVVRCILELFIPLDPLGSGIRMPFEAPIVFLVIVPIMLLLDYFFSLEFNNETEQFILSASLCIVETLILCLLFWIPYRIYFYFILNRVKTLNTIKIICNAIYNKLRRRAKLILYVFIIIIALIVYSYFVVIFTP